MKKKWYLRKAFAVGLLILALALFGCGDDGDTGPEGPQGPQGPPGPSAEDLARGIDSPNASLCFSCHQHEGVGLRSANWIRAHMDSMGGEMFGESVHGKEPKEACSACHGGFRPGGGRPAGLSDELHAGFQHQKNRTPGIWDSSVDAVSVTSGEVEVTFTIEDARAEDAPDEVNVEITLAKELSDGSWMSMLHRDRDRDDGIRVIRSGNLRLEDDDRLTDGESVEDGMRFSTFLRAAHGDYGNDTGSLARINFSDGALWRRSGDDDAATYNGDIVYQDWVQGKIDEINANGAWEDGTYRISVTGRDRTTGYVRFAAIADFELTGAGADATVAPDSVTSPRPTNQIEQASCNTCHGDRLSYPRNSVHGQQRLDVNTCFNCHNNYTWDSRNSVAEEDGWARLDMGTMIHSIHSGIEGYKADAYLYENVSYPDWTLPGTSNCASCHFGNVPGEGDGWNRSDPSIAYTCSTCHAEGGYAFENDQVIDHSNFSDPYECAGCHGTTADGPVGFQRTADAYHGVSDRLEGLRIQREDFAFKLISVEDAVFGATPVVRWQLLKWQQNDDGHSSFQPLELTEEMIDGGPRLHIGWGIGDDWTNEGSGEKSAFGPRENDDGGRPVAVNVATGENGNTVIDGDIAITTFPALTNEDAGGGQGYADLEQARDGRRGFVAIHRNINDNGDTRLLTSLVQPVTLGLGEVALAAGRRTSVNATTNIDHATNRGGSCLSCHGTIAWHGNGYTADNNIQACITCHNAGSHQSIAAVYPEPPYSVDMMYLMHKLHSDPDILYPQNMPGRCHACHAGSNEAHPVWVEDDGVTAAEINMDSFGESNCALCHDGTIHEGRLGVISDWPGSVEKYGLRGDGTDDGE